MQWEKQSAADVLQIGCSLKFRKFHKKKPALGSLFNEAAATLLKRDSTQVLSGEICGIFKNTFFTEHTSSGFFNSGNELATQNFWMRTASIKINDYDKMLRISWHYLFSVCIHKELFFIWNSVHYGERCVCYVWLSYCWICLLFKLFWFDTIIGEISPCFHRESCGPWYDWKNYYFNKMLFIIINTGNLMMTLKKNILEYSEAFFQRCS